MLYGVFENNRETNQKAIN